MLLFLQAPQAAASGALNFVQNLTSSREQFAIVAKKHHFFAVYKQQERHFFLRTNIWELLGEITTPN